MIGVSEQSYVITLLPFTLTKHLTVYGMFTVNDNAAGVTG